MNLIFRHGTEDGKIIVTKLRLWCPKLLFIAEGMKLYSSDYMKKKKKNGHISLSIFINQKNSFNQVIIEVISFD